VAPRDWGYELRPAPWQQALPLHAAEIDALVEWLKLL